MSIRSVFLGQLAPFLVRHDLQRSEFGIMAVEDRDFVRDMEKGKPVNLRRIERAERFMAEIDADPAKLEGLRQQLKDAGPFRSAVRAAQVPKSGNHRKAARAVSHAGRVARGGAQRHRAGVPS